MSTALGLRPICVIREICDIRGSAASFGCGRKVASFNRVGNAPRV